MKKRNIITSILTLTMIMSLASCSDSAAGKNVQQPVDDYKDVLSIDKDASAFWENFKETDDGDRYFINANGLVLKKEDYIMLISECNFNPDDIGSMSFEALKSYINNSNEELGTTASCSDDDVFVKSNSDVEYTLKEYTNVVNVLTPAQANFITPNIAKLFENNEYTSESSNGVTIVNFGEKKLYAESITKTALELDGETLSVEMDCPDNVIDVIAYQISDNGKKYQVEKRIDSDNLTIKGNKIKFETKKQDTDYWVEYGIVFVTG